MKILLNSFQKRKYKQLLSAIKTADSILLFTHVNPDGDAIGSLLAMYFACKKLHGNCYPVILEPLKYDLDFLPSVKDLIVLEDFPKQFSFDNSLAIAVDCADFDRLGTAKQMFKKATVRAQFDHHGTNDGYADINYLDAKACSTALMIYDFVKANGIGINQDMASVLYAGLSTDTGNFAFSNVNAHAFEAMVDLCKVGFPLSDLNYLLFRRKKVEQQRILAKALNTLSLFADGKGAYVRLSKEDLLETGADGEHTTTIINQVIEIEGVEIAFFIHESREGRVRCSFRSKKGYQVDGIAAAFGGGGHIHAAGCNIDGTIEKAIPKICAAVEKELAK